MGERGPQRATRRGAVGALAVLVALAGLVVAPVGAPSARAAGVPACRATQMRASLVLPAAPYTPARGFAATVWYTNTGAACSVTPDNLLYEAVRGPSRTVIGSSMSGAVAYRAFVLEHGRQAHARIAITSIATPAFKKLVRTHGGACTPKMADGIVLLGLGVKWPPTYFALPERVPVCTSDYFNVVGAVIAKKLTPREAQRADLVAAAAEVKNFLTVWAANGPAVAARAFLFPGTGSTAVRLARAR